LLRSRGTVKAHRRSGCPALMRGASPQGAVFMIEQTLDIATADGKMETFICRPERGGPFPAVFLLMDTPGIREELRDMARRLATTRRRGRSVRPG